MQGYLPMIIAVSVMARLIKFALPKNTSIIKYTSFFFGLCITAIMLLPVTHIISTLSKFEFSFKDITAIEENYEGIFEEEIAKTLYPSVEEYIYRVLEEKYSVKKDNAEVFIRFDTNGDVISIEQILIFLKGNAIFADTGSITLYFEEKFLCTVDVSVDLP